MYLNKKILYLFDSTVRIRRVGLRSLNLLGKSKNKTNSPKTKAALKKSIKKQKLLSFINTPKTLFSSKINYIPSTLDVSFSCSNSKYMQLSPTPKTFTKKNKYSKNNSLISKNIKLFTPKIRYLKKKEKSAFLRQNEKYYTEKMMKNSFSNNNKLTNTSSAFNINSNMNKTSTPFKSKGIILMKLSEKRNEDNKSNEYNNLINGEKNLFRCKLTRKKIDEKKGNILFNNRKKYPFVKVSKIYQIRNDNNIPDSINKVNKKLYSMLIKENISIFENSINIISKGKFSKKFENPIDCLPEQDTKKSIKLKDINLGEYIINEEKKNNVDIPDKVIDKSLIFKKFKKKLREIKLINKHLKIPMSEIIKEYKISNQIYTFEETRILNFFIKIKNLKQVLNILKLNHNLVIDIDQFHMTPLHYAAKYNFYNLIPHLISYGAYVDAKNSFGITRLMLCVKNSFLESIFILFLYMANPFVKLEKNDFNGKKDIKKEFNIKNIFDRVKEIHITNLLTKNKDYYASVKKDIYKFVMNEYKGLIETECFNLIKNDFK